MSGDPRPPWWPPHLLGLGLVQAAYWVGVLQLWERQSFARAMFDGTVEPVLFVIVMMPFTLATIGVAFAVLGPVGVPPG